MKRALLVIHTNSYFANLLPVAQLLAGAGWEATFAFVSWYPTVARDQARCRDAGFAWEGEPSPRPAPSRMQAVVTRLRATTPFVVTQHARTLRAVRARLRGVVDLLILPADNRYDLAAYVKAAHDAAVPVLAIPAFMAAANEWAQFVHADPAYQLAGIANRVAAALYPHWVHVHEGRPLLAMPASEVLARQLLGIAPPRPWTLHSGRVDALAIESEAMRRYCLLEGLPARQLVLTGSMDHDRMHARLADAAALRRAYGLGDRVFLTALAPDWLYGRGRPGCEFTEYRALVRHWITTLSATGWDVVVSLHPSVARESMAYVEEDGARIIDEPIATLIPLCDVFVACVSATIQWAIACGKPVINYDIYRFRYPDYLGVGGVLNLETVDAYREAVRRISTDDTYLQSLRDAQARAARYWGILDGKAGERLLALISSLAAGSRSAAS